MAKYVPAAFEKEQIILYTHLYHYIILNTVEKEQKGLLKVLHVKKPWYTI